MSYVFLAQGGAGSGKTAFTLTGDGMTGFHEFDPRSFDRATSGVKIDRKRIDLRQHRMPVEDLLDLGMVSVGAGGGVAPTATRSLRGWLDTYTGFIKSYFEHLNDPVQQVVIDTETRMWLVVRNAWQQQMQEAQRLANKAEIARMEPLKFVEANGRYMKISDAPDIYGKHLILTSHLKDEYVGDVKTSRLVHDGHKEAPNNADLQLEFSIVKGKPQAVIRKSLGDLRLVGMEIREPSIPMLVDMLDDVRAINLAEVPFPEKLSVEAIATARELAREMID